MMNGHDEQILSGATTVRFVACSARGAKSSSPITYGVAVLGRDAVPRAGNEEGHVRHGNHREQPLVQPLHERHGDSVRAVQSCWGD